MMKISMFLGCVAITLSAVACAAPTEPSEGGESQSPSSEPATSDKTPEVPEVASHGVSPTMRQVCRTMTCCDAADGCSVKYKCTVCD